MANQADDWGPWLGYRYDIDLNERWWHRLFKVVYFIAFALVLTFFAFLGWETSPARRLENVDITGRLDEFLARTDPTVPNVIPAFMLLPGDTAVLRTNGELGYLFSYDLEKSWCSPDAIRHLEATAAHLTERSFGRTVSTSDVLASIKNVSQDPAPRLCWFESGISQTNMSEVVKFRFKAAAERKAKAEFFFQVVGYSMLAHFILANIYYRGLVYIIVGPRRKPNESARADDDDKDFEKDGVA